MLRRRSHVYQVCHSLKLNHRFSPPFTPTMPSLDQPTISSTIYTKQILSSFASLTPSTAHIAQTFAHFPILNKHRRCISADKVVSEEMCKSMDSNPNQLFNRKSIAEIIAGAPVARIKRSDIKRRPLRRSYSMFTSMDSTKKSIFRNQQSADVLPKSERVEDESSDYVQNVSKVKTRHKRSEATHSISPKFSFSIFFKLFFVFLKIINKTFICPMQIFHISSISIKQTSKE